jgi:hypothetical protein
MSDCSKHKKEVLGEGDMKKLAEMIGDLHYDALTDFLFELSKKIEADGAKDLAGNRLALADNLLNASRGIFLAYHHVLRAWQISKPFMNPSTPHQ